MAKSKFDFDIVAHDKASDALASVAESMRLLRNETESLGRLGKAYGLNFSRGAATASRGAKTALSPLDKLGKNLKTISFGLAALNAPGATTAARLGAVVKAAAKLSELRKKSAAAAAAAEPVAAPGGAIPPGGLPPRAPGSLNEGAAWGMLAREAGAVALNLGSLTLGLGVAAAAAYKLGSAADSFVSKYSGKAQDLVYAASDIGVSTKFLQDMENVARLHGLAQGTMTSQLAQFSMTVRNARLGLNLDAARAFNMLQIPVGDKDYQRPIEDIVGDVNKVLSANKNLSSTQLLALSTIGLGTETRRIFTEAPANIAAQKAATAKATLTPADLTGLMASKITKIQSELAADAAGAHVAAGYVAPGADLFNRARKAFFDRFGRKTFYDEHPGLAPAFSPEAMSDTKVSRTNEPFQAHYLYGPQSRASQQPAPAQQPANQRIDLHITADPGVTVRDRTSPGQSNTNVRIFKSGPDAR